MDVLLVNPYIYDISAYNYFASPLGLLYVGSILRENGLTVGFIDCMAVREEKRKEDGRAPYIKKTVEKPEFLKGIQKRLKRYGISKEELIEKVKGLPEPKFILITCIMTYWYLGAKEVAQVLRDLFPKSKIILGGLYVSLCYEHGKRNIKSVDLFVPHNRLDLLYDFIETQLSISLSFKPLHYELDLFPPPLFDLYENIPFIPLLTSYGCPFNCTFCATPYLYPEKIKKKPQSVIQEIEYWRERGVNRFVLYDDSFLDSSKSHAKTILSMISDLPFKIDIYNPNALHVAYIDEEIAYLLKSAGFKEVRLALEGIGSTIQREMKQKADKKSFEKAIFNLRKAGFAEKAIGAYILCGLPFQRWEEIKESIDFAKAFGVRVHLAEFSPIPHTPIFEKFADSARYPIKDEPFFQNNSLFPFAWEGFKEEDLLFLKGYARSIES